MNSKFDAIIFDMDGVLIVNDSYNKAIIKTVDMVLENKFGKKTGIDINTIYAMKKIIGFNNDWDVCYALINLLNKKIERESFKNEVKTITPKLRKSKNYQEIIDIFQSFYLGGKLFQEVYGRKSPIKIKCGLIENEKMLLPIGTLKKLFQNYKLAIATSRPHFEAIYAARFQNISPNIILEKFIIAKEDCQREKPFPDPLLEAKKRMGANKPMYIGDTINDVLAAKSAGMESIYVGDELIGDYQIKSVNTIQEILL
jgi:HAD superfamily phosphatase